jgi:transposase-like protein
VPERRKYSDEELEAAVQAVSDPDRLEQAQRVVTSTAPQLQRIFDQAMSSADWYGSARRAEVVKAAGTADADERMDAVGRLVDEETRVSMLIGVAVGFELAHQLMERSTERTGS